MTDCTDRRTTAGREPGAPLVGDAAGADGVADVRGDELPCGRGEADAEADADGDGLLFPADGEGEPLADGEAKEISPEEVSLSDVVRP
ncbi:hypothetical protein [Streptomyces sp. NPDC014995]|uniref:hypothetical protein n=1 Tax=Streptomyces sp. NPDC014995 TaxID=3364936 RepID=UPI0036F8EA07